MVKCIIKKLIKLINYRLLSHTIKHQITQTHNPHKQKQRHNERKDQTNKLTCRGGNNQSSEHTQRDERTIN